MSAGIFKKDPEDKLLTLKAIITRGFAFVAAAQEGVETVSAAYVEGIRGDEAVVVRLASNAGVSANVRQHLDHVVSILNSVAAKGSS